MDCMSRNLSVNLMINRDMEEYISDHRVQQEPVEDDYASMSEDELDWHREIKIEPEDIDLDEHSLREDDDHDNGDVDDKDDGNYWIFIGLDDKPITGISSPERVGLEATLPQQQSCLDASPDRVYLGSASSSDHGFLDSVSSRDQVFLDSTSSHVGISKPAAFSPGRDCVQATLSPESALSPDRDGLDAVLSPEQIWLKETLSPEQAHLESAQSTEQICLESALLPEQSCLEAVDSHEDVYSEAPISGKWVYVEGPTSPQWVWLETNPSEELVCSETASSHEWTYVEEVPFSEEFCVEDPLSSEQNSVEEVLLSKQVCLEEASKRVCLEEAATSEGVCSETDLHKQVDSSAFPSTSVKVEASCESDVSSNSCSSNESHSANGKNEVESFFCDVCKKNVSKDNFSRHMRTHVTKNPFKCNKCSKSFMQSRSLLRHLRVHSQVRSRTCNYCHRKFSLYSGLVKHLTIDLNQPQKGCSLKVLLKAYYSDHCYHTKASSKLQELGIDISSDEEEIDVVSVNDEVPLSQVLQTFQNIDSNQIQHSSQDFSMEKADKSCTEQTTNQHKKSEISFTGLPSGSRNMPLNSNVKRKTKRKRQRNRTIRNKLHFAPLMSQTGFDQRSNHNEQERMRRLELNHLIEDLRVIVPKVANKKLTPRITILGEATIFCKVLQKQYQHYTSRLAELRRINYRLQLRLFQLTTLFSV